MMKHKMLNNRLKRGFTLIELMTVTMIMVLITFLMVNVAIAASRYAAKIETGDRAVGIARIAFHKMSSDISESSAVLMQYPTTGPAAFSTNYTDTMILRVPRFDGTGNIISTSYDVVIFKLVPATGADAPFELKRYRATVAGGSQSSATFDRTLASSIASMEFNYIASDTFNGDWSTKDFDLPATPLAKTSERPLEVLVGGVDRLADGKATLSGNRVTFAPLAPSGNVAIDVVYAVNPASSGGTDAITPTKIVTMVITPRIRWKNAAHIDQQRDAVISGRATLLNK